MITVIKNVSLYTPDKLGLNDVIVIGNKIFAYGTDLNDRYGEILPTLLKANPETSDLIEVIDGTGKILTPGFIDSHVHLLGGGGEGGYHTRTPEIRLTDLSTAGVTTVVGCLGTDGVTRDMMSLVAKARGLETEGITTYIYSGSYRIPVRPLTESVMMDLLAIDKVIGIGEVALSDHRSSQPTFEQFLQDVAQTRVGGMLAGKAGIVNIHLGDGPAKIDYLFRAVEASEIPITQYLPTHSNRNGELFAECIRFAKLGGTIDLTGSEDSELWEDLDGEIRVSKAIRMLLEEGVSPDNFTLSSDAQGSLPMFNDKKEFIGLGVGSARCLLKEIKDCVFGANIPLETALRALTTNPARILKLASKGRIEPNLDADILLLDEETLDIVDVMAKGRWLVKNKVPVVVGTFEAASR